MDFFEHQDRARRKSGMLVFYFILAVIFIIAGVYFAFVLTIYGVKTYEAQKQVRPEQRQEAVTLRLWYPELFLGISAGTIFLVTCGSLYKIASLSGGGEAVASMLGGQLIDPGTRDADERKLLNVVEEMAIASGTPVPPVYLLADEEGINAFAAGFSTENAVIGVTRGCMHLLNRDELQGVIAHEFSHILNGDMRLNIRLIGILHGILLIGMIGFLIFRIMLYSGAGRRRSSGGKKGGGQLPIIVLGLLLMIVGYVGVFFGKLIKSALSRQREYLADASSVQFTRNPSGIANALKKIGGLFSGSRIGNSHAEEASHLFFGNALKSSFLGMMSTHPPLAKRIRRVEPRFDGTYPEVERPKGARPALKDQYAGAEAEAEAGPETPGEEAGLGEIGTEIFGTGALGRGAETIAIVPAMLIAQVGMPQAAHLNYAKALRKSIPEPLTEAAHEAYGARAVIYGLLLDPDESIRAKQLKRLEARAESAVYNDTIKLLPEFAKLDPRQYLPLVDIALPALQALSERQYQFFRENVQYLAEADEQISLFEYALQRTLLRNLEPKFSRRKRTPIKYYALKPVRAECAVLLSTLARIGEEDAGEAGKAFTMGSSRLKLKPGAVTFLPEDQCTLTAVDEALERLDTVAPKQKKLLIEACAICIAADRKITVDEAELLRVVADSLGCPIPPLLPGQTL